MSLHLTNLDAVNELSIPRSDGMVVATMATFPARVESAARAVASLVPQVDRLYLYLNGYHSIPAFARHDRVVPVLGGPDLSACGKAVALDYVRNSVVLTVDDDFVYPANYVAKLHQVLRRHHGQALVCVHGSIFPPKVQWYYERSTVYVTPRAAESCRFAMLAGSGTAMFDQSALDPRFELFAGEVAVDLRLSILARDRKIPVLCVDRDADWLVPLRPDGGLWREFFSRITHHTEILKQNGPWTYEHYTSMICEWFQRVHGPLDRARWVSLGLDEHFHDAIVTRAVHADWRRTRLASKRRKQYRALVAQSRASSPVWQAVYRARRSLERARSTSRIWQAVRHPRRTVLRLRSLFSPAI